MPEDRDEREHDIVVFGATGFTGGLTAHYLARHAPHDCRWAIAGRNRTKLEAVREQLMTIDPALSSLPLLVADVTDAKSLAAVAAASRVVITTVGPFLEYGEPLVAACAGAGTDYADLTGEAEFVDRMYVRYHDKAVQSGARIVHACGFDSIPHDLGARFTVLQLPEGVPIRMRGMLRAGGAISGGTFASALAAMARGRKMKQAAAERRRIEPKVTGRRVRASAKAPHHDQESGYWLVPLPTLDPLVVKRSAAALERYGPDFEYSHYAAVRRLPTLVGGLAVVAGIAGVAHVPPLRKVLLGRLPQGQGPGPEKREKSWFSMRFIAQGGGRRVVTEVKGGDPGYGETSKMLAESGLCLAFDDNPDVAGQVTTAVAMGEHLTNRLIAAGLTFTVVEKEQLA